jgi:hypothetical protein
MQTAILSPAAIPLQARIGRARSWADLELLCEHIDDAYQRGELELSSADELSALVASAALKVPEQPSIPAEALLGREREMPHNTRQAA